MRDVTHAIDRSGSQTTVHQLELDIIRRRNVRKREKVLEVMAKHPKLEGEHWVAKSG